MSGQNAEVGDVEEEKLKKVLAEGCEVPRVGSNAAVTAKGLRLGNFILSQALPHLQWRSTACRIST